MQAYNATLQQIGFGSVQMEILDQITHLTSAMIALHGSALGSRYWKRRNRGALGLYFSAMIIGDIQMIQVARTRQ